eukprot:1068181-Prorocentrum_minimum.AAC.1
MRNTTAGSDGFSRCNRWPRSPKGLTPPSVGSPIDYPPARTGYVSSSNVVIALKRFRAQPYRGPSLGIAA